MRFSPLKLTLQTAVAMGVMALSLTAAAQDTRETTTTTTTETEVPAATPTPAPSPTPAPEEKRNSGGFFIEPGVTYELGDTKIKTSKYTGGVFNDSTGDADGLGAVLRLGFHVSDIVFVAADGRYSWLDHKSSIDNQKSDAEAYQLAPVIGFQTPFAGIRVWGGYIALAEMDPAGTDQWDFKFKEGTGPLFGAGLRFGAVSLNVEYKNVKYDSTSLQRGPLGVSAPNTDVETEDEAWIASLTFPLAL